MLKKNLIVFVLIGIFPFLGAMNGNTKFFLKLGNEKVKITRSGLDLTWKLKDFLAEFGDEEENFNKERNEFVIDLDILLRGKKFYKDINIAHVRAFAEISDDNDNEINKTLNSIKIEALIQLIVLADFLGSTKFIEAVVSHEPDRDIIGLLAKEIVERISSDNYLEFLDGKGFLWSLVKKFSHLGPVLKEKLKAIFITMFKNVIRVKFSPDGKMFSIKFDDSKAKLFVISGEKIKELKSFEGVSEVKFSPDGKMFSIKFDDFRAKLFVISGEEIKELKSFERVSRVKFSPDGKMFSIKFMIFRVKLFVISGEKIKELKSFEGVDRFEFSPDGKMFLVEFDETKAKLFVISGEKIKELKSFERVDRFEFSPDGKMFLVEFGAKTKLFVISGEKIKELKSFEGVHKVKFSPDGKMFLVEFMNSKAKLFVISGEKIKELKSFDRVHKVKFSPDGKMFLVEFMNSKAKLFVISGEKIKELKSFEGVNRFEFSPDGSFAILSISGELEIVRELFYEELSFAQSIFVHALRLSSVLDRSNFGIYEDVDGYYIKRNSTTEKIIKNDFLKKILESFSRETLNLLNWLGLIDISVETVIKKREEKLLVGPEMEQLD